MAQNPTDGFYAALDEAEQRGGAPGATTQERSAMRTMQAYQASIGKIRKAVRVGAITKEDGDRTIRSLVSKALAEAEQSATAAR